jgi:hypothetical protein
MISMDVTINNPYCKKFRNLWNKFYNTPFKNKFIELEVYNDSTIVVCSMRLTNRRDHAGLDIMLGLFGYCVHFNFYDNRHWDYELNKWKTSND